MKIIKHILHLNAEERNSLTKIVKTGKGSAAKLTHARILLAADEANGPALTDAEIGEQLLVSESTVQRVRRTAVESGLEIALNRKRHVMKNPRMMDGEKEARLIKICCSTPPVGRSRWTMNLLAAELIRLEIFNEVSPSTVQRTLKKTNLSLG